MSQKIVEYLQHVEKLVQTGVGGYRKVNEAVSKLEKYLLSGTQQPLRALTGRVRTLLCLHYEYLGRFNAAETVLEPYDPERHPNILDKLRKVDDKGFARIAVHLSHVIYRRRKFDDARRLAEQ